MVVNHPIDPRDRVTMAKMRSMVIGTKGERHRAGGARAVRSVDGADAVG
jgi:hypothetical protein